MLKTLRWHVRNQQMPVSLGYINRIVWHRAAVIGINPQKDRAPASNLSVRVIEFVRLNIRKFQRLKPLLKDRRIGIDNVPSQGVPLRGS